MAESLTYVIADLHGRFDLLEAALTAIADHANDRDFKIVTLGDYVDRGPQSRLVIERLMAAQAEGVNLICLKGNHEQMMYQAMSPSESASVRALARNAWRRNGGESTLASYDNVVPPDHLRWIGGLPTIHVEEHRVFVHAGVDPTKALHKQTDEFLLWYRYPPNANIGYGKRHVVHGHTPNPRGPEKRSRQTNLDTLAWKTGRLVVAVFDDQRPGGATEYIELPQRQPTVLTKPATDGHDTPRNEENLDFLMGTESLLEAHSRKKHDPFHECDLDQKIGLRWALRDIHAKRYMVAPVNPVHLEKLILLNLVEMRSNDLALTDAGLEAIDHS